MLTDATIAPGPGAASFKRAAVDCACATRLLSNAAAICGYAAGPSQKDVPGFACAAAFFMLPAAAQARDRPADNCAIRESATIPVAVRNDAMIATQLRRALWYFARKEQ